MAGIMRGVAWLIPYCARHHPSDLKDNGCRGSACSPLSGQDGRRPQTARVITRCNLKSNGYPAHHPPHFLRGRAAGLAFTARVITHCNLKSNGYPALYPPRPGTNKS